MRRGTAFQDAVCAACSDCDPGYFRPKFCVDFSNGVETVDYAGWREKANTVVCSSVVFPNKTLLHPREGCLRGGLGFGGGGTDKKFGCKRCKVCTNLVLKAGRTAGWSTAPRTANGGKNDGGARSACTSDIDRTCQSSKGDVGSGVCAKNSALYDPRKCDKKIREAAAALSAVCHTTVSNDVPVFEVVRARHHVSWRDGET